MPVLPPSIQEQIQFCETHIPVWNAAPPASIGLTAGQITSLTASTTKARQAFDEAQAAREASKAFTTKLHADAAALRANVADLIRQVKAYAELQNDPSTVYLAAQIPPPAAPTPATAPGTPTNITVTLESTGAVTLSWDATDAAAGSGAFFNITRKLPGQGAFVPIGGAPGSTTESRRMSFTDFTVPTSAAGSGAQYIITGRRGNHTGEPSEAIIVQFGVDGTTFTVSGGEALKMAA